MSDELRYFAEILPEKGGPRRRSHLTSLLESTLKELDAYEGKVDVLVAILPNRGECFSIDCWEIKPLSEERIDKIVKRVLGKDEA